jgi:FkbM family methyltransferase
VPSKPEQNRKTKVASARRRCTKAPGGNKSGRKAKQPSPTPHGANTVKAIQPLPVYEMREARAVDAREADNELFDAARSQWLTADWDALAGWHLSEFANHPKRARIALLVAAALHEVGDHDGSKEALRQALGWGAQRRDLINVVIGQAHAALGRARLVEKEFGRAEKHFLACITSIAPNRAAARYAKDRVFKEAVALGFLPDALDLLKSEVGGLVEQAPHEPQTKILETKLIFLSQQLALAQQRNQLAQVKQKHDLNFEASESLIRDRAQISNKSCSQLGQDVWVLERTKFERPGFFVDIGATDGILFNNTFLLESEFGWRGICAEPNPDYFAKLAQNRTCTVSADCIAGESGREVEFVLADEFGGITEYCKDMHDERRRAFKDLGKTLMFKTTSLDDFLRKHNAPRTIDYLSIDTEGSEYEILKNFPFDQWEVRLITVEHNFTPMRQSIRELLTAKGYVCQEAQWDDWYELTPPGNRG